LLVGILIERKQASSNLFNAPVAVKNEGDEVPLPDLEHEPKLNNGSSHKITFLSAQAPQHCQMGFMVKKRRCQIIS
jgi:hypothetical protein